MNNYNTNQVKIYMDIYGTMIHLSYLFKWGIIIDEKDKKLVERTIQEAKDKFPNELITKDYRSLLNKLEQIIENSQ